jgi:GT2 family glycosyltransferase
MEYNKHEVTVILTVWKRNHLKEQIEALIGQTITPTQIWVIQCMRHVSVQEVLKEFPFVKFIYADIDLKYFSRFSIGIHAPSEFTWVLDDDIIPGCAWIENCITTSIEHNAIISSNGRIIPPNDFYPEKIKGAGYMSQHFIGNSPVKAAPNFCEKDTFVDFPCSSYFFRTDWLQYFWGIWPVNFKAAEDIHFAVSCMLMRQIGT